MVSKQMVNILVCKLLVYDKFLAIGKLSVVGKLLANGQFSSVGKNLVDTKHLASIKMLTDPTYLTYLPDLTIDEKLDYSSYEKFLILMDGRCLWTINKKSLCSLNVKLTPWLIMEHSNNVHAT